MYGDADGGGFFTGDNSFGAGTPQQPKKPTPKRAQNIMPVTARQILMSGEDGLQIGGLDVYLVTIIGIVKAVEITSVKMTYTIEDDTGCIDGVHWLDGHDENGETSQPAVVENAYCRLSGTIRSQGDSRYIMVFNIQQLEDLNEITSHRLEVALFSKKAESLASLSEPMDTGMGALPRAGMSNELSNSLITTNAGPSIAGLTGDQQQVLSVIQRCATDNGIHVNDIQPQLKDKMSQKDIQNVVDFLCGEGHIYTTVDEYHYRTTDSN